jgi:FAD/FMN-containing dehydrogenase
LLPGRVHFAGDKQYDILTTSWNGRHRASPIAVVSAVSARDIAAALSWARQRGIAVVPRSGGHSYIGSSLSDGLIIDVSPMSSLTHKAKNDAQNGFATIGAGARLGPIYGSLYCNHGQRTFTSGSCPSVGISGIAVGGGYSSQSRLTGLTIDAICRYEVVLADGSIVQAGSLPERGRERERELFWALRGGGASFGIVSKVDIKTRPWVPLSVVTMTWPWAASAQAFAAWSAWIATLPSNATSTTTWSTVTGGSPRLRTQVRSVESLAAAQSLAQSLEYAVGSTSTRTNSSTAVPSCTEDGLGTGTPSKNVSLFATGSIPLSAAQMIKAAFDARVGHPQIAQSDLGQIISHAFGGQVAAVMPSDTAFPHRNATLLSQILSGWSADATESRALASIAWVTELRDALQSSYGGGAYLNYPDERLTQWKSAYWGENVSRLQRAKNTYDPDRVFRGRQFIP